VHTAADMQDILPAQGVVGEGHSLWARSQMGAAIAVEEHHIEGRHIVVGEGRHIDAEVHHIAVRVRHIVGRGRGHRIGVEQTGRRAFVVAVVQC
jgi:hypothetical protein